jgi:nitrate/nitrite transport system ATP-binding protein
VISLVLSRNGNAITLDKDLYDQGVRSLEDFANLVKRPSEKSHTLAVVHPTSMHNLMLRYWLASGGIDPDQEVNLAVIPPAQMVANLTANNIDGYCAGEPWNSRAVHEGLGVVLATDLDIWAGHPEKVLGVREDWANQYPQTNLALVKALLEACEYCDDRRNREEILALLSQPQYVGSAPEYIRPGFIDPYNKGTDEEPQNLLRYNQFYVDRSNYPQQSESLWILTQLARWGITPFPKNWVEVLQRTHRLDVYREASQQLGYPVLEPDRSPFHLFDGVVFNPDDPLSYLNGFAIHRTLQIAEINLDSPSTVAA